MKIDLRRYVDKTIGECLEERVQKTPEGIAVRFQEESITWKELDELSDWLVLRFHSFGMKKGSRAAIWCANCLQWVIVYMGLQKIGALAVLMNPGYLEEEAHKILSYAEVEYLFYGDRYKDLMIPEILDRIDLKANPLLKQTIPIEAHEAIVFMQENAAKMTEDDRKLIRELRSRVVADDLSSMIFTSGTTALPKGVLLAHRNLTRDAKATVEAMGWNEQDKICVTVSLFHSFGMTSCLIGGLITGHCICLMKNYRTINALETIQQCGCTVLNGVPSMFLAMVHNRNLRDYDIHTLKTGILAGSSVSPEEYKLICKTLSFERLQMSYGQTETSPGVTFSRYDDTIEDKCDNVGYLIDDIEACIWDESGKQHVITDGEGILVRGELGIRGYVVMQGYYNMPDATAKAIEKDGWLHTGDIAYFDERLRLHIVGRAKDMIIRGGENIGPAEVEDCIRGLEEVKDVKVVGVPHPVLQEEVGAVVVLHHGCTLETETIKEHVKAHLAHYKVPAHVAFLEELPMNSSGKIKTGALRDYMKNYVCAQGNIN